jgi:prohibitin 1
MSRFFRGFGMISIGLATVGIGGMALSSSLYNVDAGHRGLIFDRVQGVKPIVYSEGTHMLIPGIQRAIVLDVRTLPRSINTQTATKDLQNVNLSLRVLSHPSLPHLATLFKEYGTDYGERVLPGICNEVLKAVVAQYDAEELITLRDQVSKAVRISLAARAKDFHLIVDDVSITHLNFSKDFSKAIEDKQVAEQNAERAKFVVAKAEQEKEALIIRSEGDSEAARLVSDALQRSGKGLIELRRIETAVQIADSLSKNTQITYLPSQKQSGGGGILLGVSGR